MDFGVFKEAILEAVVQVHMYPNYTFMQSKNNRMLLSKSMLLTSLQAWKHVQGIQNGPDAVQRKMHNQGLFTPNAFAPFSDHQPP